MSVPYYGDFAEDDTVYMPFNTFTSSDPAISATITELIDGDIKVYKDAGTTPIATDGATIAINFASGTGTHMITVDTSVHADYAAGSEYAVKIEGVTIDVGADIDAFVGAFSIERTGGVLSILKAGAVKVDVDTIKTNPVVNGGTVTFATNTTVANTAGAVGSVTATVTADVDTIKTNPVVNGGTITFPTTATLASTTNITAGTVAVATAVTTVNGLAANVITAAAIQDGAIDNATFAADVGTTAYATNNIALAANKMLDDAMVETSGAPAITGTFRAALEWMFALSRNKITQTATTTTLVADDTTTPLATSSTTDDATTYTRNEWST